MAQPSPAELLDHFANTATWAEAKQLVEAHPELLGEEVTTLLNTNLTQSRPHSKAVRVLEDCRLVLARCRTQGIDAAFADRILTPALKSTLSRLRDPALAQDHQARIDIAETALAEQVSRESNPRTWATIQVYLGNAHGQLGDPRHLTEAWNAYQAALEVLEGEQMREEQSAVLRNLGLLHLYHGKGPARSDKEQAIALLQRALELADRELAPMTWAATAHALGCAYRDRAEGRRADNLERAIELLEQCLEVRQPEHALLPWAVTANELAVTLDQRLNGTPADNKNRAQTLLETILASGIDRHDPLLWAQATANLGVIHFLNHDGSTERLNRAIALFSDAAPILERSPDPNEWLSVIDNLAIAHAERGSEGDLEYAIDRYRELLDRQRCAQIPPLQQAISRLNLGNVYLNQGEAGDADALEQAIGEYTLALPQLSAGDTPDYHAIVLGNLGNAFRLRQQGPRAENLARATDYYRQAIDLREEAGNVWEAAVVRSNLAVALSEQPGQNRATEQEEAIELHLAADPVLERSGRQRERARNLNNLGAVYAERLLGNRGENIERAVRCYEQTLQVRDALNHPEERAETQHNLAIAYLLRSRGSRNTNVERAIEGFRQALAGRPRAVRQRQWAETQHGLGRAHALRTTGEREANLTRAIAHFRRASAAIDRTAWPSLWARVQNSLGDAWLHRREPDRRANLAHAVAAYQRALRARGADTAPIEWAESRNNLGIALGELHWRGEDCGKQAIEALHDALRTHTLAAMPEEHRLTQRNLGDIHFRRGRWSKALAAYQAALNAGERLYTTGSSRHTRQPQLQENRDLSTRTAYCLVQLQRNSEAVEVIERGRVRSLTETLALDSANLERVPARAAAEFEHARADVAALDRDLTRAQQEGTQRFVESLDRLAGARHRLTEIIDRIRRDEPGFLPPTPDFETIQRAAQPSPILYLAATPAGGVALLVEPDRTPRSIPLPELTSVTVEHELYDQPGRTGYLSGISGDSAALQESLPRLLPYLNDAVSRPLVTCLTEWQMREVLLIPAGSLAVLPLCACHWGALMPRLVPSVRLIDNTRTTEHFPTAAEYRYLGLADTAALPLAAAEMSAAETQFATATVATDSGQLQRTLTDADYLHLAVHAGFDPWNPPDSALRLPGDERLTLGQLLDTRQDFDRLRLVTLSACQSGISEFLYTPDEVIGFPLALLVAGVDGVIATLWPVDDAASALLMWRFHQHLVAGLPPHEALHQARVWLRDADGRKLADACTDWLDAIGGKDKSLYRLWRVLRARTTERPFAAPRHWAGHFYVGT